MEGPLTIDRLRDLTLPTGTSFTTGEAATLAFAYFTVGLTVAVLHVSEGTSVWVMLVAVFLVNSVTPGLAYVAVIESGGSQIAGVLSGWLVSTRFGLFAAAVAPRLWRSKRARAMAAHTAFDPNVALALREQSDDNLRRVYVASSFWLCVPWWIGGGIGAVIGSNIGDPNTLGLDAIFPAVLLVIVWPQLRERRPLTIAMVAVVAAIVLVEPTPGGVPVLAAACASMLALRSDGVGGSSETSDDDNDQVN